MIEAGPLAPVSYWNKTWLDYTGQSVEEALGRAWDGIIHPDDVPVVMEYYTPAFMAYQPYFIPAVRVKRYDDLYRWHSFKGNPRYGPDGKFSGYVGVGFDIHEQKLSEEALEEIVSQRTKQLNISNKELQRSNQNLEEFAHAASHDLKEPIRKILFFTQQLKDRLSIA
jgi:PAS domain S-box-containing protein